MSKKIVTTLVLGGMSLLTLVYIVKAYKTGKKEPSKINDDDSKSIKALKKIDRDKLSPEAEKKIEGQMRNIKNSESWFEGVKKKAIQEGNEVECQLRLEAIKVLKTLKKI